MPELRRISLVAVVLLVLVRLSIGWQFLYEGLWKLNTQDSAKPWTADGYLKNAAGPFRDTFRSMTDDPDDLKWLDYEHVSNQWDIWKAHFVAHYGLTLDQQKQLDLLMDGPENYSAPLTQMPTLSNGKGMFEVPPAEGMEALKEYGLQVREEYAKLSEVENPTPEQQQKLENLKTELQNLSAEFRLLSTLGDPTLLGKVISYSPDSQELVISAKWHMTPLEKKQVVDLVQERTAEEREELQQLIRESWPVVEGDQEEIESWVAELNDTPVLQWKDIPEFKLLGKAVKEKFGTPTGTSIRIMQAMAEVAAVKHEKKQAAPTVTEGPVEAPIPELATADDTARIAELAGALSGWDAFGLSLEMVYASNAQLAYREKLQASLTGDRERVGVENEEQNEVRMGEIAKYKERLQRYEENLANADQPYEFDHLNHDWKEIQQLKSTVVGPVKALDAGLKKDALAMLDAKQTQMGAVKLPATKIDRINWMTIWSLLLLGGMLIAGFGTRIAAVMGAGMVLSFYLVMPPWPGVPEVPGPEHSFLVNKNLIEVIALLAIAAMPTGSWFGIDGLIARGFRSMKTKVSRNGGTRTLTPPSKSAKDGSKKAGATTTT